ncbi:hypothetical protein [Bacillus litorisediminis]|uniref:hypothetical protein n=1 Tax=Bacillus litorisediminis TaxID=2922713 RepID=UPI001FAC80C2|nr:hypothetical protein [Bacillus litorisediminis]
MFDKTDPRSGFGSTKNQKPNEFTKAKHVKFYEELPSMQTPNTKTWWARGQNFFINYSETNGRASFIRKNQIDEYVVLIPDKETQVVIEWNGLQHVTDGFCLIVVPSGESTVTLIEGGRIVQLFTILNKDIAELPINKDDYYESDPNVADFEPWPLSPKGEEVRIYSLDVPKEKGRFGRIFRCSTFMVNYLEPKNGPRDPSKLSPHSHDDFEQCSLILDGEYIHHLRWPWLTDKTKWREDEHEYCKGPSVTVIPPGVIHTSEAIGAGLNQLVDIFCPPRRDFSEETGWVLNDKDYQLK